MDILKADGSAMAMQASKYQWKPLPHGHSIPNDLARWSTVRRRLAEHPRLYLRAAIETGFFPFAIMSGCIIFLLGLSLPNGIAVAILFTSIVLMGLWAPHRYSALWLAGGGTVLLLLGFVFSTDDRSTIPVMIDRLFTLISLWVVALIGHLCYQDDWKKEQMTCDPKKGFWTVGGYISPRNEPPKEEII